MFNKVFGYSNYKQNHLKKQISSFSQSVLNHYSFDLASDLRIKLSIANFALI